MQAENAEAFSFRVVGFLVATVLVEVAVAVFFGDSPKMPARIIKASNPPPPKTRTFLRVDQSDTGNDLSD